MNDRNEILNDYLMGDLSPERRAELLAEIERDPLLAAELERLSPLVASLEELPAEAWDGVDAPPLKLPAAQDVPVAPRTKRSAGFWRTPLTLRPIPAFAAVLAVFAAGFVVSTIASDDGNAPAAGPVVARADLAPVRAVSSTATGEAAVEDEGHRIRLRISGLARNHDDDFYEAWLMDSKNGLVSIGAFRVGDDGMATLDLPLPVATDRFPVVDISLQPTNGKPDHSGVSVLRGTLN